MKIIIKAETDSTIICFAKRILDDWIDKINHQSFSVGSKVNILTYFVQLRAKQPEPSTFIKDSPDNPHLIVILDKSQLSVPHLLSLSGQLSTFGQRQEYFVPAYLAEITIANCLAITILGYFFSFVKNSLKNIQKEIKSPKTHKLNYIDCLKYFGAFNISAKQHGFMQKKRGNNILDGGAPFYSIYPTKQGLLAVGNLEPKFFSEMLEQMELVKQDLQFCLQNQLNMQAWPKMRQIFYEKFATKTATQWQKIMNKKDTCVTLIRQKLEIPENFLHPYLLRPNL